MIRGGSHGAVWGEILLSRRKNPGEVLEAGMSLVCPKGREEARVIRRIETPRRVPGRMELEDKRGVGILF